MNERIVLGDLISITRGKTYHSSLLGRPGPVLLGLASIARNGGFRADSLKTYGGDSPETLLVHPGELYASLKDVTQSADLLGSVARVPSTGPVGRLTQDTVRLDLISEAVDPTYLYLSLLTPDYRDWCRSHATGTTNLGLPREDFLAYQVPLPPLPEQRRIANVLCSLDDLIDTDRALRAEVRETGQTLTAHALSMDEARTVELGDVAASISRGVAPRYVDQESDGVLVLNQKCIRDHYVTVNQARHMEPRSPSREKRVSGGDILVCSTGTGTLGRVGRWHGGEIFADGHVSIVQPDPMRVAPTVLAYCLFDKETDIEDLATGSTGQTELSPQRLKSLTLNLPPQSEEARLEPVLMGVEQSIAALDEEIDDLTRTRDDMLPLLMSGRIRASEVGQRFNAPLDREGGE